LENYLAKNFKRILKTTFCYYRPDSENKYTRGFVFLEFVSFLFLFESTNRQNAFIATHKLWLRALGNFA
jgi:hypothetical protein